MKCSAVWPAALVLLSLTSCVPRTEPSGPASRPELRQEAVNGAVGWIVSEPPHLDGNNLPTWYLVQGATPIPGSAIYRIVGVAQDNGRATSSSRKVNLLYITPGAQLSTAGLNTILPATTDAEVRVGASFSRVIGTSEPGVLVLNIGALDGVFAGARYTFLSNPTWESPTAPARWTEIGSCRVRGDGIFDQYAHCRLEEGSSAPPEGTFARRVEDGISRATLQAAVVADADSPCQVQVPAGGALESMGAPGVCRVLRKAKADFAERFGTFGEGGELGLYLDQSYLDPRGADRAGTAGWGGVPQRARMEDRVREWMARPEQRVLLVSGPMASGKTTFAMKMSHDLSRDTLEMGQGRVPVMVPLARVLQQGETLNDVSGPLLISRSLEMITGQQIDPALVQKDVAAGVLLPIFDGLDEVTLGQPIPTATRGYGNLVKSTTGTSGKMIVLCRSSLQTNDPLAELNKVIFQAVDATPSQSRVQLVPFNEDLLLTYLTRMMPDPDQRQKALAQLQSAYDIQTLARTPLLLYLVAQYLAREDSAALPESPFALYDTYTRGWSSEILGSRGVDPAGQQSFLHRTQALGLALLIQGSSEIGERALQAFIRERPWLEAPIDPDNAWEMALSEARGGAFVQKTAAGSLRFVEPSFAAFFAAQALARTITPPLSGPTTSETVAIVSERLSVVPSRDDTLRFLAQAMGKGDAIDRGIQGMLSENLSPSSLSALYRLRIFRQDAADPTLPPRPGGLAEHARITFQNLYDQEMTMVREQANKGVAALLRSPAGGRYANVAGMNFLVRDRQDGTTWAYIPAVPFIFGTVGEGGSNLVRRTPSRPFLAAVSPVTHGDLVNFVAAKTYTPHPPPPGMPEAIFLAPWGRNVVAPEGKLDQPATFMSWQDVLAFAKWRTSKAGVVERPFSEVEWEQAARGSLGRQYPWGDIWDVNRAASQRAELSGPTAVGTYPTGTSPYGLTHMAGNVWQWVSQGESTGDKAQPALRGGSWQTGPLQLTTTTRRADGLSPQLRTADIGLRLRRDVPEAALNNP